MEFNQPSLDELHQQARVSLVRYRDAPLGSDEEADAIVALHEQTMQAQAEFEALHSLSSVPRADILSCIRGEYNPRELYQLRINRLSVSSWFIHCYSRRTDNEYIDTILEEGQLAFAYCGLRYIVAETPKINYLGLSIFGYCDVTIDGWRDLYLASFPLDATQIHFRQHQEN